MSETFLKLYLSLFRFDEKESVSNTNNVKSSVQKTFRNQILEQFCNMEDYIDEILPKKEPLRVTKW